ncbi:translation initiation factor IF-2 N-terminal domain-containing protein, partial [bacterium]|nr:translation initiation factor IF-2 N-terminal domain-containing protein [bacterium]MBU1025663.1 translation initiation factor IF-2 N-terminal domain-containing protein [bacterium]
MRVHTLSKELDISATKIIAFLQSQGFNIKGPLNTLGDSEIEAVTKNLDVLKGEKISKKPEIPSKGTKKKVFIRSKQSPDPRARTRRSDLPQQIRPSQIPQKRGASKVAQVAMAHQKASAQKEKEQLVEEEKRLIAAKEAAEKKPAEKPAIVSPQRKPDDAARPDRVKERKFVHDKTKTDRGEKPKFSKEEAIRAARAKRRPGGSRNPAPSRDQGAGVATTKGETRGPRPTDSKQKRRPPRPGSRDTRTPNFKDQERNVVLEGKALDVGISRLKAGIKTSVNADTKTTGKPKRRKKIVQEKKRFKVPG